MSQLTLRGLDNTSSAFVSDISRHWQAPGAVKKIKMKSKKNPIFFFLNQKIVPVPIYVFVDSEQKAEFKAKIKPCSHQLNCMKFYCSFIKDILEDVKISNKFNESFLSYR